ncbi:MAG: hypothetical protein KAS32_30060 [Candidatus Peribacteraceae bacterium]|nr:hypothetical protein [Candidatus Peribacteraceae bacterium]
MVRATEAEERSKLAYELILNMANKGPMAEEFMYFIEYENPAIEFILNEELRNYSTQHSIDLPINIHGSKTHFINNVECYNIKEFLNSTLLIFTIKEKVREYTISLLIDNNDICLYSKFEIKEDKQIREEESKKLIEKMTSFVSDNYLDKYVYHVYTHDIEHVYRLIKDNCNCIVDLVDKPDAIITEPDGNKYRYSIMDYTLNKPSDVLKYIDSGDIIFLHTISIMDHPILNEQGVFTHTTKKLITVRMSKITH